MVEGLFLEIILHCGFFHRGSGLFSPVARNHDMFKLSLPMGTIGISIIRYGRERWDPALPFEQPLSSLNHYLPLERFRPNLNVERPVKFFQPPLPYGVTPIKPIASSISAFVTNLNSSTPSVAARCCSAFSRAARASLVTTGCGNAKTADFNLLIAEY